MIATGRRDGGYEWLAMFTPELVAEAERDLAEAEALAATERQKVAQAGRVRALGFRFTEAWTRMREHADGATWPAAVAAGEEAIARLKATGGTEPQAFWIRSPSGRRVDDAALPRRGGARTGVTSTTFRTRPHARAA